MTFYTMSPRSPNSFGVASHSLSRPWNRLFNLNSHPRPMAMLQKRILPPLLKTAWSWRIQIISDRIQSDHPTASCPRNFTLSLPVNHRFASARTVHEDSRRGASVDHGAVENLMLVAFTLVGTGTALAIPTLVFPVKHAPRVVLMRLRTSRATVTDWLHRSLCGRSCACLWPLRALWRSLLRRSGLVSWCLLRRSGLLSGCLLSWFGLLE
jgi:hypothetical protein